MDYSAEVRRRFAAALARNTAEQLGAEFTAAGEAGDRVRGVWARARIGVSADHLTAVQFDVWGCPDTIAAASLAAERMRGTPLAAFHGLDVRDLALELDIPVEKIGKLLCLEDAALAAVRLAKAQMKKGIENGSITD